MRAFRFGGILLATLCLFSGLVQSARAVAITEVISKATDDSESNQGSGYSCISSDGRYVVFQSPSTNLLPGISGIYFQIFVRDREAGTIELISKAPDGSEADSSCYNPVISGDGRYIAFHSRASNLVTGTTGNFHQIYLYDRVTGVTELISKGPTGGEATQESSDAAVSADGAFVAFHSYDAGLVPDAETHVQVYVRDRAGNKTELVSQGPTGIKADGDSMYPRISADGRYVAYMAAASNLVTGVSAAYNQIYVRDRVAKTTTVASQSSGGEVGNDDSHFAALSPDGRYVGYESVASNLVTGTPSGRQIYLRDQVSGKTELISKAADGSAANDSCYRPVINSGGRFVAYESIATNVMAGLTGTFYQILVRDRAAGSTKLITKTSGGDEGDADSYQPAMDSSGKFVSYESRATNLVSGVSGTYTQILLVDRGDISMPNLVVNQAEDQADPTMNTHIMFTATFAEPVTDFSSGDVTISGTAGATKAVVTNPSSDKMVYNIDISGMTTSGTVIVSIAAGVAHDSSGNPNLDSESTDNEVTYNLNLYPPENVSLSPSGGTLGTTKTSFAALYRDQNGHADIRKAYLLINDSLGLTNAVLVLYDRLVNRLYLRNDAGTGWSDAYAPGTDVVLENSQAFFYVKDTTISQSGNDLTVNWAVGLKNPFPAKSLNGYMYVQDEGSHEVGWTRMGIYYNVKPQVLSISPSTGPLPNNTKTTLTSVYRDLNGFADLRKCYVLLCENFSQANAMFILYDKAVNKVYLKNDANTSWGVGYAPGTNITLSNSQCEVYVKDITVVGAGTDLTVTWSFKLKLSMVDANLFSWMYITDTKGLFDSWKKVGIHFTPLPPTCVSVAPIGGKVQSETPLSFVTDYSDPNGWGDIYRCYFQISQTSSQANAALVYYDSKVNKIFLKNDGNTNWGVGYEPGTNVILENSQCRVYVKDTTVTPSGKSGIIINWSIALKSKLVPKLLGVRMYCRDNEMLNSGWKFKGYVRAQ